MHCSRTPPAGRTLPRLLATAALSIAVAAAGTARAADPPPPADAPAPVAAPASDWRFQATLYGWMTAVDGDLGIRNLPTVPVNASFADLLPDLDGAAMGAVSASNGNWLFLADLVYARLSQKGNVGLLGRSKLQVSFSQTIVTAAAGYWLPLGVEKLDVAATVGARFVQLSSDVSLRPARRPKRSGSATETWIDPTIGFAARYAVDDKWFVNAVADIGGFGAGSQLSSTGYAGVGYQWTPAVSTALGYRYLYEDYENGGFRYRTTLHGPTLSLALHF